MYMHIWIIYFWTVCISMCVYIYICICVYEYICICLYMYICIYRYIYVYKYVYIRMCLHVYTCVCVCARARACVSVCAGRQVLSCMYVYMCTYMYISHVYVSVYLCVSECVCVHRNHGTQPTSEVYTSKSTLLMKMYTYGKRLLPCLSVRVHTLQNIWDLLISYTHRSHDCLTSGLVHFPYSVLPLLHSSCTESKMPHRLKCMYRKRQFLCFFCMSI